MSNNQMNDNSFFGLVKEMYPRLTASLIVLGMVVVIVGILVILGVAFLSEDSTVLENLQNPAFARGLITFVFAIGTIGIALLLTFAALQRGRTEQEREDTRARFERGKEVLTILVGILGTIIGFYFGSTEGGLSRAAPEQEMRIEGLQARGSSEEGGFLTIVAIVSGGAAPYTYSLTPNPEDLLDKKEALQSEDGLIFADYVLKDVEEDIEGKVVLTVADATGLVKEEETRVGIKDKKAPPAE